MSDSILLIQSKKPNKSSMGTGFVIANDKDGSFVLTCNHVIEAVAEPKIDDYDVRIEVQNFDLDLALLYVKDLHCEPLTLKIQSLEHTKEVKFIGYENWTEYNPSEMKDAEVISKLDFQSKLDNSSHFEWKIKVNHENYHIRSGNSGGPLICLKTEKVIGVMRFKSNKTSWGYAIDIVHLRELWKDMLPSLLLQQKGKNPFVGLKAFTKDEKHFFFGRDKEITEISDKLNKKGFLAVVGDSGSGKSSIIKAGVIPKYEKQGYFVLEMRPANEPYEELSTELNDTVPIGDNSNIIQKLHQYCEYKETKLLFYIDQFEELFIGNQKHTEAFLKMLLYIANSENQRSKLQIDIVYTMRSDYILLVENYKEFYSLVHNQEYVVRRIKDEPLKEVIYKPLIYDHVFTQEEAKKFADFVVEKMGDEPSEITLLQIALTQTWFEHEEGDSLKSAYIKAKGIKGALQGLAEETIKRIGQRELIKTIFIRLLNFDKNNKHTRRIAERNEFTDAQWEVVQKLASALNERGESKTAQEAKFGRLLKLSKSKKEEEQQVELVHEALIRSWDTYIDWINEVSFFKQEHDVVMVKTKEYAVGEASFLRDIELRKSLILLDESYYNFLSEAERKYLIASQEFEEEEKQKQYNMIRDLKIGESKNRKRIKQLVGISVLLFGVLLLSLYFKNEAIKSEKKVLEVLDVATESAVDVVDFNDTNKVIKTFDFISENFQETTDLKVLKIIVKAWFGTGKIYQNQGKYEDAIDTYNTLIRKLSANKNDDILLYVCKALSDKAVIFYENNEITNTIDTYITLIETFKDTRDDRILTIVLKAWFNKSILEPRAEKIKTLRKLINYFNSNKNQVVQRKIVDAYRNLSWFTLLNKNYADSVKFAKEGLKIDRNEVITHLQLADAYLLLGYISKSKQIYCKYTDRLDDIEKNFSLYRENNITSIYFNKVNTWCTFKN